MAVNLLNLQDRMQYLSDVKNEENYIRKSESLAAFEVYNDRVDNYVRGYLRQQYGNKALLEMPVISTVNLCKRIAIKESSLYKETPERTFTNLTQDQHNELLALYADSEIDAKLFKSNVFFKIQNQNFIKVLPKDGELDIKVLLPHHLDVIPDSSDVENASAYILNSFDKRRYIATDVRDQIDADADDYRAMLEKYVVWTESENYMFDGKGNIIGEVVPNPIGMLPIIDVSGDKDFEFFVRVGHALVDFTIQYNAALSDLAQVVKMQGWAQAYIKGTKEVMTESLSVGPTKILHLVIDPNSQHPTEFGYASPNSDVAGSIHHVENLLSNFLTSRGIDPNAVNGKAQVIKYNSGIDRLLAMVEQMEASKQDALIYQCVEDQLFEVIKKWSSVTFGTDKQFLSFVIPDDCEVNVDFKKPQMVESDADKIATIQLKLELGLMTKKMALMELYGLDDEGADELLKEIEDENQPMDAMQAQIDQLTQQNAGNVIQPPSVPPVKQPTVNVKQTTVK